MWTDYWTFLTPLPFCGQFYLIRLIVVMWKFSKNPSPAMSTWFMNAPIPYTYSLENKTVLYQILNNFFSSYILFSRFFKDFMYVGIRRYLVLYSRSSCFPDYIYYLNTIYSRVPNSSPGPYKCTGSTLSKK